MIYENVPPKVVISKPKDVCYVTVFMDVTEVEGGYECESIHLQMPETPTYDTLINALIRHRYPSDKMEAIINNYLLEATDEAKAEFAEMQAWRKEVKEFAKEVFDERATGD